MFKTYDLFDHRNINDLVPENFWDDVIAAMTGEFRAGRFAEGLSVAAVMAGEKLREFFPYQEDDVNEQPDEISFGGGK